MDPTPEKACQAVAPPCETLKTTPTGAGSGRWKGKHQFYPPLLQESEEEVVLTPIETDERGRRSQNRSKRLENEGDNLKDRFCRLTELTFLDFVVGMGAGMYQGPATQLPNNGRLFTEKCVPLPLSRRRAR
ncbi:hypothetical protein U0070_011248 [Myodes glareolus]|uniref:Uncharacterized protein n=1 Tax=Myodes glareolus TaxID=447135 RepID=A0AAW0HBN9_MYOGA